MRPRYRAGLVYHSRRPGMPEFPRCPAGLCQTVDHYLGVLLRMQVGVMMAQTRNVQRLERAERLVLGEKGASLLEAALAAGLQDKSSFRRSYRQAHGESPRLLKAR